MPRWDRADLHTAFKRETRRPTIDREATEERIDGWLTEAQDHWHRAICMQFPQVHWNAVPVVMTSDDGGYTWRVTDVDQFIGPVRVRQGAVRGPIVPGDQFVVDPVAGTIRSLFDSPLTFTPYIQYAAPLEAISNGEVPTEPQLRPDYARRLVVLGACRLFALSGGGIRSPDYYAQLEQRAWIGDPAFPGEPGILDTLRHAYGIQPGELAEESSYGIWYKGIPDFR